MAQLLIIVSKKDFALVGLLDSPLIISLFVLVRVIFMVNIANVGTTVTAPASDNNLRTPTETARTTANTPNIDPTKQPKFVDRRRNPDRRTKNEAPLLDTRRNVDRRRTARLDIEV